MVGTIVTVTHLAQADRPGHVLQLAIAIGGTGQTIKGMVGNIELHDAAAQPGQTFGLGADLHSFLHRRGAGGGRALGPLDFHQAEPARPESLKTVGGAKLGDFDAGLDRRTHHRRSDRDRHVMAVALYR